MGDFLTSQCHMLANKLTMLNLNTQTIKVEKAKNELNLQNYRSSVWNNYHKSGMVLTASKREGEAESGMGEQNNSQKFIDGVKMVGVKRGTSSKLNGIFDTGENELQLTLISLLTFKVSSSVWASGCEAVSLLLLWLPVSFWTRAMKSWACVWMIFGECA